MCLFTELFRSTDQLPVRFSCVEIAPTLAEEIVPLPTVKGGTIPVPVVTVPMYPCEDTFAIRLMNNITAIRILFDAILPTHYRLLADAINNGNGLALLIKQDDFLRIEENFDYTKYTIKNASRASPGKALSVAFHQTGATETCPPIFR